MISIGSLRRIDPLNTTHLSDEELEAIRKSLYEQGQLIFEDWHDSKYPIGSLTIVASGHTI